jgi:uncharacterized damage-inducible protein DinB
MTLIPTASIRQSLVQAPRILEGLIAAAPKDALTWREAEGTWNVVDVLAHLADGEITDWMPRIEKILSGASRFTPFDREAGFVRYQGWTALALVGEFGQLRRSNLDKLTAIPLSSPIMALTGEHPELGTVTMDQLFACWATHDMAHIAQISRVLTRWFGRGVGPWRQYFSLLQEESPNP